MAGIHCCCAKLYSSECTVYSVQCTVYIVQYTVYSVQCTVYSVKCTVYNVHSTSTSALVVPPNLPCSMWAILANTARIRRRWLVLWFTLLYSTVLYCTLLHSTPLYSTVLAIHYCTLQLPINDVLNTRPQRTEAHLYLRVVCLHTLVYSWTLLQYTVENCSTIKSTAVLYSLLQCTLLYCRTLQVPAVHLCVLHNWVLHDNSRATEVSPPGPQK